MKVKYFDLAPETQTNNPATIARIKLSECDTEYEIREYSNIIYNLLLREAKNLKRIN